MIKNFLIRGRIYINLELNIGLVRFKEGFGARYILNKFFGKYYEANAQIFEVS